ncbi:Sm-like ribonucleoprotein [Vararia minispora EC-137]|uniref:Sm-like ribonucleoprotein n=1 Tax=Vararia minispora EC-137 TaxID=1314806 RepID=A0ACB8QP63_9AGAM|nr:Sm-like ribonucleoprotein [Vararia minispora EC-137]
MDSLIPFTTSGSLVDCVDRKMLVILRDGRKLHGVLRSYDQFANLVLEDTVERIYSGNTFAEKWCGLFLIRGENVVLLGEIDLDQEDDVPLQQVDFELLDGHHRHEAAEKRHRDDTKAKVLFEQKGFCREGGEGDGY